jgi:hypothetical protein
MGFFNELTLDQTEPTTPIRRTAKQQRREDNSNRLSEIMRLVRAGKTMAEALKIVDGETSR